MHYKIHPTKQQSENFLTLLFLAQAASDLCHELKGSPYDFQHIKMHMNGILKEVKKFDNLTNELFEIDANAAQGCYENALNLVSNIFKLPADDWQYIEGLRRILEDKNETTVKIKSQIFNYHAKS